MLFISNSVRVFCIYAPGVGPLVPYFVSGEDFVHNDCPGRRVFAPLSCVPGIDGGMVRDEIDSCISSFEQFENEKRHTVLYITGHSKCTTSYVLTVLEHSQTLSHTK